MKETMKERTKRLASELRRKWFAPFAMAALQRGTFKRQQKLRGKS